MRIKIIALAVLCAMTLSACTAAPAAEKSLGGADAAPVNSPAAEQPAQSPEAAEPEQTDAAPAQSAQPDAQDEPEDKTEQTPEPSAAAPEETPEETPDEAQDVSAMTGTWYKQGSFAVLNVFDDGTFTYDDYAGRWEGYLVYTEEDAGPWESGARYDMYLENGEKLHGNSSLIFDADEPESLTYVLAVGAELMGREIPESYSEPAVEVRYFRDVESNIGEYDVYETGGEYSVKVAFFAQRPLKEFRLLDLFLQDVDEDGNADFLYTERYACDELDPSTPLVADTEFFGSIPNNGISYIDWDGSERYFALSQSGEDGSLQLTEF